MVYTGMLGIVVAGLIWMRVAPHDVARWHVPVGQADDLTGPGWAVRVIRTRPGILGGIHEAMLDMPRTVLLAGSLAENRLTYVTRSKWIGFPDYTTVEQAADTIRLYGRLRFGRSDLGVNARRLDRAVKAVQP